jgi:hypothetical protein
MGPAGAFVVSVTAMRHEVTMTEHPNSPAVNALSGLIEKSGGRRVPAAPVIAYPANAIARCAAIALPKGIGTAFPIWRATDDFEPTKRCVSGNP